jgi:four helix bundle protein
MAFDHERLDVYQRSLDFLELTEQVIEALPRGRGHLSDQLHRATTSIILNIAEGSGKFSPGDKRRYYLSASGSATECAAILDVFLRLKAVSPETHRKGKETLDRIVAMLVGLAKSMDAQKAGSGSGRGSG